MQLVMSFHIFFSFETSVMTLSEWTDQTIVLATCCLSLQGYFHNFNQTRVDDLSSIT